MARRRTRGASRRGRWLLLAIALLVLWAGFRLTSGSVGRERGAELEPTSPGATAPDAASIAPGGSPDGPLALPSATASPAAAMAAQRAADAPAKRPAVREELTEDDRRALEEVLDRAGRSDAR